MKRFVLLINKRLACLWACAPPSWGRASRERWCRCSALGWCSGEAASGWSPSQREALEILRQNTRSDVTFLTTWEVNGNSNLLRKWLRGVVELDFVLASPEDLVYRNSGGQMCRVCCHDLSCVSEVTWSVGTFQLWFSVQLCNCHVKHPFRWVPFGLFVNIAYRTIWLSELLLLL